MAVEKRYSCSLCHDYHQPENLVGIYWDAYDELVKKPAVDVNHHLCQKCLDGVAEIAKQYNAMRPVKEN